MRVAAIQMTSGHDIEANLEQAGRFLADAARLGATLAALPENFAFMGKDSGDKRAIAEPDGAGRIQNFLADTARRLKIWIVGGTVPLRQDADGRVSASCLVYAAGGQRAARYDKMHLFDVDVPGRRIPWPVMTRGWSIHRPASSGWRCVTTCGFPNCFA